ncbi:hypothetical protein [Bradyrhizobium australafricanum]|uniref:hypothetical protein n=1 Tax=Bradyrhizobium australafricanum TaxID=2821406 RepID=UPI001CE37778|nr:hypothetical protein [Bradyrhizobium australafricanum]MCA6101839.1 hypothetical protein [Bradyrhizobium australafricanum]
MDLELKTRIRAELFRCAVAGEFPTYAEFFGRIHPGKSMGNFPYQTHFNEIAREERGLGYPDITFVVRGAKGYPHQIDFRDARGGPDADQLRSLQAGIEDVIRLYSPRNTTNPYL